MVLEYYVAVFPVNYVNIFFIGSTTNKQSYVKYIYMIDWEHNHIVLKDHARISNIIEPLIVIMFMAVELNY